MYCLKCKRKTPTINESMTITSNGKKQKKGKCKACGTQKREFTGGDIVGMINKTGKEFHIPGYNFCGPGTKLKQRLDANDNPIPGSEPVNDIDRACMKHDINYRDNKDLASRHVADAQLIGDLNALKNLKLTEKFTRGLIKNAMKGKITFGMGVKKDKLYI